MKRIKTHTRLIKTFKNNQGTKKLWLKKYKKTTKTTFWKNYNTLNKQKVENGPKQFMQVMPWLMTNKLWSDYNK